MKDTVFISHATPTDNTFAVWLATKLELCGYKVWIDINNLSPSVDFWNTIDQTIRNEAVKFIFVMSNASIDPNRDGVRKELAVADKVRRQNANFIIPVRIENISFNDLPIEVIRLNAIDFNNDWAKGLDELLQYLTDENVPKINATGASESYTNRWNNSQGQTRSQIIETEDEYYSNLFLVDLPPFVYIYKTSDAEAVLKSRHIPVKKNNTVVISFACNKCVCEWVDRKIEYEKIRTEDAINICKKPKFILGEKITNLSRDVISIINWSIGDMLYSHGMIRYKVSQKTSKNVYYFPFGTKSKRFGGIREKKLSGVYKSTKRWHYGLSGYFTNYPMQGIIFKWHLVFSDEKGHLLSDSSQIAARRSKGRLLYNNQWKEYMQTSMYFLSAGTSSIPYTACCETNEMHISSQAERFTSKKGYSEPHGAKQMEGDNDE